MGVLGFSLLMVLWLIAPNPVQSAPPPPADEITIYSVGEPIRKGALSQWTTREIRLQSSPSAFATADILSLSTTRTPLPAAVDGPWIWLANGDRWRARPIELQGEQLRVEWQVPSDWPAWPNWSVPIANVSALVMNLPSTEIPRQRLYHDLRSTEAGDDEVLLLNGERTRGTVDELTATQLSLKTADGTLTLDRGRVRAVRFNPELISVTKPKDLLTVLLLADGSRVTLSSVRYEPGRLQGTLAVGGEVTIPLLAVTQARFYSPRIVPVVSRTPREARFVPYLTATWPWRRDENVLRGPLRLRGQDYATGIGVHSRSILEYEIEAADFAFHAVVGIDDIANGRGSVSFAVERDDQVVWSSGELDGKADPASTPIVPLSGAKRLRLVVDFGADADISDYADWCDAVFIRKP